MASLERAFDVKECEEESSVRVLVRGEPVMELDRGPWESVEKASEVRDREEDEKVGLGLARTPRPPIRVNLG